MTEKSLVLPKRCPSGSVSTRKKTTVTVWKQTKTVFDGKRTKD